MCLFTHSKGIKIGPSCQEIRGVSNIPQTLKHPVCLQSAKTLLTPQREVTTAVRTISTVTRATIDESSEPSVEMDRLCPNGLDAAMNKTGGGLGSFRWVVDIYIHMWLWLKQIYVSTLPKSVLQRGK